MLEERLTAQLLAGPPARDPVAVAERLLAIQAQDPRGARLAIRARSTGLEAGDIDHALTEDRSLVVTWLNRGTLQLVRSEDYPWLHALTMPPLFTGNARRLEQEGVTPADAERGVRVIQRSLADGPLTRLQLRERLDRAGVPTKGQALVHLLMPASLRGLVVRGPMIGNEQAYVLAGDWLGKPAAVDRDTALAELARRYLAGHGPAADRDLARWAGLPLREARAGLRAIASELEKRADGLVHLARRRRRATNLPPPRLLGAFEPVLLGWTSREWLVGAHQNLITIGGLFRPFALVEGRAAAVWSLRSREFELEPFGRLPGGVKAALEADAREVARFLGV